MFSDVTSLDHQSISPRVTKIIEQTQSFHTVLVTGLLSSRKRLLPLLRASDFLGEDHRIIVAGDFSPENFAGSELSEIENRLTNDKKVVFSPVGLNKEEDLNALIKNSSTIYLAYADSTVLTSR